MRGDYKMSYIDLHVHSKYSDGTLNPQEVIDYYTANKTYIISITDHNTIDAYFQKFNCRDTKLITGVEIDIDYSPEIQCLCYDFDFKNQNLVKALKTIQLKRMQAKVKLVRNLLKRGIINHSEINTICELNDFEHICKYLARKTTDFTSADIKEKYFLEGKPLYQEIPTMKLADCIHLIHKAGGIVILAHPGRIHVPISSLSKLFDKLLWQGIDGFECYHPDHSVEFSEFIKEYCINNNCVYSGGSDMHGKTTTFCISKEKIIPFWRTDNGMSKN